MSSLVQSHGRPTMMGQRHIVLGAGDVLSDLYPGQRAGGRGVSGGSSGDVGEAEIRLAFSPWILWLLEIVPYLAPWSETFKCRSVIQQIFMIVHTPDKVLGGWGYSGEQDRQSLFPKRTYILVRCTYVPVDNREYCNSVSSPALFLWIQNSLDYGDFCPFRLLLSLRCLLSCMHTCYIYRLWRLQRW